MGISKLTLRQKEKARACESAEELAAFAAEEGMELSEEQLDGVYGGINWPDCPTYKPGSDTGEPIPEALSNNPRVVHLIRSEVHL